MRITQNDVPTPMAMRTHTHQMRFSTAANPPWPWAATTLHQLGRVERAQRASEVDSFSVPLAQAADGLGAPAGQGHGLDRRVGHEAEDQAAGGPELGRDGVVP